MKCSLISPREIDGDCLALWEEFRRARPVYASPFYSPQFSQAVGRIRNDARVAIFEQDGRTVGFLPFHLVRGNIGKPIGGHLNDYQGPVLAPDCSVAPSAFLKAAGLAAYDFDHLPAELCESDADAGRGATSPQMDLTHGYADCIARKGPSWKRGVSDMLRKRRKMEREIGPIRFTFCDHSDATFESHIAMRNALYRRAGMRRDFCDGWAGKVLRSIRAKRGTDFSAVMSTLHAGDQLVAAHFGMRSGGVLHWWFPAYDLAAGHYSPGLNLINHCAMEAAEQGISLIDFGRGDARYKRLFADQDVELCAGSMVRPGTFAATLRRACDKLLPLAERVLPSAIRTYPRRALSHLI